MATIEQIVIVGAGLAGARAAEALRKRGYDGAIVLLGEEPERPYLRPPLSKNYLRGEAERGDVDVHPEAYYEEQAIDLRLSTPAQAIDLISREVVLGDGHRLPFDRLLLATGAEPRRLDAPGADLPGVFTLRTLADADALRAAASDAERAVVVGTGWIGSEVAASLRMLDRHVVLVGPGATPLERVLGPEIGGVLRDLHAERGVDLRLGTTVSRIVGTQRVEAVETAAGERIATDIVVVGVGVRPRTGLAEAAGLAIDDGIAVGQTLETSAPGIFAAGDVAAAWHPFYERRLRSEHWANARFGGFAAGAAMIGSTAPYERLPYFYSDQHDLSLEYTGHASPTDELVVRGSLADREFVAFWLQDGRVIAGLNANVKDAAKPIGRLIQSRAAIDANRLADPSIALDDLVPEAPAEPAG